MKLAIIQPTFNPWLGYFDLIDYVDKAVFLDTVQLSRQSWQTRNKIKIQGKELLISVPIIKNKAMKDLLIKDAQIDYRKFDFRKKLIRTLEQGYKRSAFFNEVDEFIKNILSFETSGLGSYNINMITEIARKLGIKTKFEILSNTNFSSNASKANLVLAICKYFNAEQYVSPLGSKKYLKKDMAIFSEASIKIEFQYYQHPEYSQSGENFLSHLGVIDLLYNEGFKNSLGLIKSGREYI